MNIKKKGSVLIEFALIAPILLVLLLGVFEVGYTLYVKNLLLATVQSGAEIASFGTTSATVIKTNMTTQFGQSMSTSVANQVTWSVTPDPAVSSRGTAITVSGTLAITAFSITNFPIDFTGKNITAQNLIYRQ